MKNVTQKNQELINSAIENQTAQTLTLDLVKALKGKKIVTKYFGYNGQDGIDCFVVGDLKLEHMTWGNNDPEFHRKKAQENAYFDRVVLFTAEGRNTFINGRYNYEPEMWCSDSDRFVFFVEIK